VLLWLKTIKSTCDDGPIYRIIVARGVPGDLPLTCVVRAALRFGVEIATRRSAKGRGLQQFSLTCCQVLGSSPWWFVIYAHTLPTTIGACRSVLQARYSESLFVRSRGRDGSAERRTRVPLVDIRWGCGLELMDLDVALWTLASGQVPCVLYSLHRWPVGRWHISGHTLLHRPLFGMLGQSALGAKRHQHRRLTLSPPRIWPPWLALPPL
jgi:hypothetical protein